LSLFSSRQCRRALLALLAVAALGGCQIFQKDPIVCPPITIIPDAAQLVRYGAGRDLTDVLFEANLEQISPVCQPKGDTLIVELSVALTARRGPAMPQGNATFSYFVAVTSADRELLARQEFPVDIPLGPEGRRVRLTELVEPTLPLKPDQSQFSYRIFVGLVLTREELEENRR